MEPSEELPKLFKRLENEDKLLKLTAILVSSFSKKSEALTQKTHELRLFKDLLVSSKLKDSSSHKELVLTFDVSFEVIRLPQEKPKDVL